METFERLFAARPRAAACDLHPDYLSTREAESRAKQARLPLYRIQHHWAHMAACMADNGLEGPAFGILWDGTGLGADGTVWGCEFFKGDFTHYTRVGSMRPIRLPGGEAAIREIGRIALSLLRDAGLPDTRAPVKDALRKPLCAMVEKNLSCVEASSAGRLFDGVYALLSGTPCAAYDGEAPVLLESMLRAEVAGRRYPVAFYEENGVRRFDPRPMIRKLSEDLADGVPAAAIAKGFHDAMCEMALSQCEALNPEKAPVVLSGGVFFNQYLLTKLPRMLKAAGFRSFATTAFRRATRASAWASSQSRRKRRNVQHVPCHPVKNPLHRRQNRRGRSGGPHTKGPRRFPARFTDWRLRDGTRGICHSENDRGAGEI